MSRRFLTATVAVLASLVVPTFGYAIHQPAVKQQSIVRIAHVSNVAQPVNAWAAGDSAAAFSRWIEARNQQRFIEYVAAQKAAFSAWITALPKPPPPPPPPQPVVVAAPAPTPPPVSAAVVAAPASGTCADIVRSFFPNDYDNAMRIANRESGCTGGARNPAPCSGNGDYATGVFQLCMPMHADLFSDIDPNGVSCAGRWTDVWCGVAAAHRLYLGEGGWYPAWGG